MKRAETCGNCAHCDKGSAIAGPTQRAPECRANYPAPAIAIAREGVMCAGVWPTVRLEQWCAQWKPESVN